MPAFWSLLILLFLPAPSQASDTNAAGPGPLIDLVMVGPGDSFYSAFGHTAILVRRKPTTPLKNGQLYNFGVTAFGDADFLLNFVKGTAIFWGNVRPYSRQRARWQKEDRTTKRFRLLIPSPIARKIHAQLQRMVDTKTREFEYDLFRQNCVTKIRDIIDEHTQGLLSKSWKGDDVEGTFRGRAKFGYSQHAAVYFGFQWFPGKQMDAQGDPWLRSGEPSFFEQEIRRITQAHGGPLLAAPVVDYRRQGPSPVGQAVLWYPISHGLLSVFLIGLALFGRPRSPRVQGICLMAWAFFSAVLGSLLMGIHFWTQWVELKANLLMLVAWPSDLILLLPAIALLRRRAVESTWLIAYVNTHLLVAISLIALGPLIPGLDGPAFPRLVLLSAWILVRRMVSRPKESS